MTKSQNKNSPSGESKTQNALRDLGGIFLIFIALFSALALISFKSQDPSWFTASNFNAKNWGGIVGSYWSAALLQIFGAASFVFAFSILLAGVALFRKISRKEFALALANYFLLIFTAAATLGISRTSMHYGDSNIALGGLIGIELGGVLRQYLNTAGALLLTLCLLSFALSISLQMQLRDMALYAWWGISKCAVTMGALFVYMIMQFAGLLQNFRESALPQIRASLVEVLRSSRGLLAQFNKPKDPEVKISLPPEIKTQLAVEAALAPSQIDAPPTIKEQIKSAVGLAGKKSDSLTTAGAEPVIVPRGSAQIKGLGLDDDTQDTAGQPSGASVISKFVKSMVRENERNIKEALGKKIHYQLPPLHFLHAPTIEEAKIDRDELYSNSALLKEKLADFSIDGAVTAVNPGPVVTMYEFKPGPGVKVNTIANMADDLALALSAEGVRIVAPIPGRDVVGVEVPNRQRERVFLKEIIASDVFKDPKHAIPIAIGKDILGNPCVADLRKMPHLLVAGTTGSGKSVFINALICSLLYKFSPDELKLILVDPKQLELNLYEDIPHLLLPVVTEPKKASLALRWTVEEMERRYRLIAKVGMRDADGFNQKLAAVGQEKIMELLQESGDPALADVSNCEPMPRLVIIIDELADLMMTAKADVETNICRIAQKARAAGIHLVLATQRPSTDVVTGLIKANLQSRISFRLASKVDSRVIFESMGAEKLVGSGDMLFMPPGESKLLRMHGAFIGEREIEQVTDFWREQGKPQYREEILLDPEESADMEGGFGSNEDDPRFKEALDIAYSIGSISASLLQRRMGLGYPKAARFVEIMEARGIVGPSQGSKPRPIISARPGQL